MGKNRSFASSAVPVDNQGNWPGSGETGGSFTKAWTVASLGTSPVPEPGDTRTFGARLYWRNAAFLCTAPSKALPSKLTVVRALRPAESSPKLASLIRSLSSLTIAAYRKEWGCVHSPISDVVGSSEPPHLYPFAPLLPQWSNGRPTDPFLFFLLRSFSTQNSSVPLPLVAHTRGDFG